jgi:hypothetical protein
MEVLPMTIQAIKQNDIRRKRLLVLLVISLIISGCGSTNPKPPELETGLVFPGADNTIALSGFWFNMEGNGVSQADRTVMESDPIGGYLFLYWIDDKGNVCHGQPGVSGQPGPVYIKAFQQQAFDLSQQNSIITTTQLVDFQKIPSRIKSYVLGANISGLHFVQYGNVIWRDRNDGSTAFFKGNVFFSVPLVISVDTTNTLFPYYPDKQNICNSEGLPLPSVSTTGLGQDPNMCATRVFPGVDSMKYQDSLNYCLIKLPQGLIWTEWP